MFSGLASAPRWGPRTGVRGVASAATATVMLARKGTQLIYLSAALLYTVLFVSVVCFLFCLFLLRISFNSSTFVPPSLRRHGLRCVFPHARRLNSFPVDVVDVALSALSQVPVRRQWTRSREREVFLAPPRTKTSFPGRGWCRASYPAEGNRKLVA